jgi:DNA-binding SARP family transcriptional activator
MARKQMAAQAGPVRFVLSGRVGVASYGIEHELHGRYQPVLLALLATERRRAVPRDELAEALWGEELPDTWQSSLRVAISKVRTFLVSAGLEADCLQSGAGGYRLRLGDEVEVDIEAARNDLEAAEQALASGDFDAARDLAASARAVLVGPLLPGGEGPWIDEKRRVVKGLLVRALEAEADAYTARGEGARAAGAAQQAIDLEPFHESAHRALMRAHAFAGNKAEALSSYEACRQTLVEELGVDPAPATQALHLQILKDELIPAVPAARAHAVFETGDIGLLLAGQKALSQRRWQEAFEFLSRADRERPLGPEDLGALGEAAMWSGHHSESVLARQRAHSLYLEAGDACGAARVALALASNHGIRGQSSVAEGWFRTAARLLEGEPSRPEHGLLAFVAALVFFEADELDASLANAQRAFEAGQQFGSPDLQAAGITFQGLVLARQDRLKEALPLLDEGMAQAISGRLTPLTTGVIYCRTVRTWLDLFEYRRAAEWIETIAQCSTANSFGGNPGDCNAHLAAAMVARGSWDEAEREAALACELCEDYELSHVGLASYTLGEIHLLRGDLAQAEEAFQRANANNVVPQPGIALLQLARGNATGALASVRAWLASTRIRLVRARALPAAVEVGLAAGDIGWAQSAGEELARIAEAYESPALRAAAAHARGALAMAQGRTASAVQDLRRAIDEYRSAQIPYEMARARSLLAEALLGEGDRAGAVMELQAATGLFTRLGAIPAARASGQRLKRLEARASS